MTLDPVQVSLGDALASIADRFRALPSSVPKADSLDWLEAEVESGTQHMAFRVREAIFLSDLRGLIETMPRPSITRVPDQEPWFAGVSNIRGDIVSVIDLALFLRLDNRARAANPKQQGVLLARATDPTRKIGFLVDGVIGIRRIAESEIDSDTASLGSDEHPFTVASTVIGEGSGKILDFRQIADSPELQDFTLRGE